ncbi:HesA/MoeB/ThiF family protein [Micromonospora zhanjiangensis]|uniref:HesA/MoeB/ThiF family protein n=1 Tax=Micromonospora zhanjiangensis TaxID=1522057 RepID=A0ABV8KW78_9ACTN
MPVRPQLKSVLWERVGDSLRLVYDVRDQLMIADPDGGVERLLALLREGGRTVAELAEAMGLPAEDIMAGLAVFDDHRLLEDGERLGGYTGAAAERHFSNLAFFESFATLATSREDFQRRLADAHVLVLGTGGLNSNTIPHLCGLGIGRLTLLDRDVVEPRNFARQYLYTQADLGATKVERAGAWVRAFDPSIEVATVTAGIDGPDAVSALVERYRPDVVMSGVDSPTSIDDWVNDACVAAGVPFVRGGMYVTQGVVWSVDPGRSACRACGRSAPALDPDDPELAAARLLNTRPQTNRGIGPVAGLLGALCAFEVLRLLTRFEPPAYAGRPMLIDFAAGCTTSRGEWVRDPACPICGDRAPAEPVPAAAAMSGGGGDRT